VEKVENPEETEAECDAEETVAKVDSVSGIKNKRKGQCMRSRRKN
jgi:hypothetical protein